MQNKKLAPTQSIAIIEKRIPIILAGVTAAALGIYLLASFNYFRIGFPLDDAWIHQTYARSLAQTGKWEYFHGQFSAGGSTSPLWSLLLAIGHFLKLNVYVWTYLLGWLCLWGTSLIAELTTRHMIGLYRPALPWVGILVASEWHLVWAAVSGMETSLYILLILLFFAFLLTEYQNFLLPGLIVGVSVWVRPDAMTLLIPLFLSIILKKLPLQNKIKNIGFAGAGFALLVIPYLVFNLALTGFILPNTFYAKQTEYASLQQIPFNQRFFEQILQPLTGVGIILMPAILVEIYQATQKRDWAIISACLWLIGYPGLYALRLPVTYQHGRYVMPIIAPFLLLGSLAAAEWFTHAGNQIINKLFQRTWIISAALICTIFFAIGAWTYSRDVAIIESEMVITARWVAENIPPDTLVAAHDIGALGYFGSHRLIDLAGLISPEIIPVMRDQAMLANFLNKNNVQYLVAFPNWYPDLIKGKTVVFSSGSIFGKTEGGENMTVYHWK